MWPYFAGQYISIEARRGLNCHHSSSLMDSNKETAVACSFDFMCLHREDIKLTVTQLVKMSPPLLARNSMTHYYVSKILPVDPAFNNIHPPHITTHYIININMHFILQSLFDYLKRFLPSRCPTCNMACNCSIWHCCMCRVYLYSVILMLRV
jgi:hypothetical protein